MSAHPNRSKRTTDDARRNPTPGDIIEARTRAGLTALEAAQLCYSTESKWKLWEAGERRMHPFWWEAWLAKARTFGYFP